MRITEENVVQQIKNKNEKCISFIINEYGGILTSIIKRHVNYDKQDYEECLDDVLLSIWNHIESFEPAKNSFKQWIAAIAKFKAIDYQRRKITRQNHQFSVADITDSMYKRKQTTNTHDVKHLLEQLPTNERRILEQYYIEGIPSREIAKEYHAKESWVHNKLSRGRKKLKNLFFQKNEV